MKATGVVQAVKSAAAKLSAAFEAKLFASFVEQSWAKA